VPILALTASVMPGDAERYAAAGMDDHLGKPIDRAALTGALARAAAAGPGRAAPAEGVA
jgi:CheY-like chemotaxis protein